MDIIDIIARETANYMETARKAGRLGDYVTASAASASAQTLIDLQTKIKSLQKEALAPMDKALTDAGFEIGAMRGGATQNSRKPKVSMPKRYFSSGKQWSLDPSLNVSDIDRILGQGKQYRVTGDGGKVKYSWRFLVDGKECAIWNYHTTRWSGYGPKECFEALGIKIYGN